MTNEQSIISQARQGDQRAFEELVRAYEQKVYNLGLRYTGNEHDAWDVCQEVFLRVFRFLPQFHQDSQFSTWLYRIAVNVCKDAMRKRSSHQELSLELNDEDGQEFAAEVADLRYNPEDQAEHMELREALKEAILSLPPSHREIIILRDISGLTYEEIGKTLSLEQGTVKSRISRAREKLRLFLTQSGNLSPPSQSKKSERGAGNGTV